MRDARTPITQETQERSGPGRSREVGLISGTDMGSRLFQGLFRKESGVAVGAEGERIQEGRRRALILIE